MLKPLLIDGHEDLAYNMLTFGRDYTLSMNQIRSREVDTDIPNHNGDTLLGWTEYQKGRVAVVFATLFAAPYRRKLGDWDTQVYMDMAEAHRIYHHQMDIYHALVEEHPDKFRLISTRADLESHLVMWNDAGSAKETENPVGLVILMENAEGLREPDELEQWWENGLRIIGPAWAGTRFCGGTREPGPLTQEGELLLEKMAEYGYILDLSHMDETAVFQAVDRYPGSVIASHSNALSLLKGIDSNRYLTDRMIAALLERNAVIGIVPANSFLLPDWQNRGGRSAVTLNDVAAQIDYVCQIAGDANHVAVGSDFDGGFGVQSVPADLDSIADLQKLVPVLQNKGYQDADILAIFSGNWIRILQENLP